MSYFVQKDGAFMTGCNGGLLVYDYQHVIPIYSQKTCSDLTIESNIYSMRNITGNASLVGYGYDYRAYLPAVIYDPIHSTTMDFPAYYAYVYGQAPFSFDLYVSGYRFQQLHSVFGWKTEARTGKIASVEVKSDCRVMVNDVFCGIWGQFRSLQN